MIIRVRSDAGLWRVPDLDDDTATVDDVLRTIDRSVRPGATYDRPLSFDPSCDRPIDPGRTLKEQGFVHGSMIYCRVSLVSGGEGGGGAGAAGAASAREGVAAAAPPRPPPATGGVGTVGVGATAAELRAAVAERRNRAAADRPRGGIPSPPPEDPVEEESSDAEGDTDVGDDISKDEDDEREDEDGGPPTCRICLGEGVPVSRSSGSGSETASNADDRLISPCLCRGTVRYVHVACLQQWRASAHGRSDSALRCGQCRYVYGVNRSGLALFLMSDNGAPTLAAVAMAAAIHVLGLLCFVASTGDGREALYRWLRLGNHRGGGAAFLRETAYGEVLTLGGTALGCLTFANYAIGQTVRHYALYREGLIDASRLHFVGLLLFWIYGEIAQARSGRGLAVIGLFMACYHSYEGAMAKAKVAAQWLGETILEPTAADRRRHEREERERHRRAQEAR